MLYISNVQQMRYNILSEALVIYNKGRETNISTFKSVLYVPSFLYEIPLRKAKNYSFVVFCAALHAMMQLMMKVEK